MFVGPGLKKSCRPRGLAFKDDPLGVEKGGQGLTLHDTRGSRAKSRWRRCASAIPAICLSFAVRESVDGDARWKARPRPDGCVAARERGGHEAPALPYPHHR